MGGYSFRCDLRDAIAREVCFTGRYEPQETALVRAFLQPGMTFVDVGANWGYFTLLAAHLVGPEGRVLSLEPDPRLFRTLQENVRRNRLDQVWPFPVAASNGPGTLTLAGYDERSDNWGLSKLVEEAGGATSFSVAAQPLDGLLDQVGIDRVDLLKMDIEGAEELALHGMRAGLSRSRYRRILLEVHPAILGERGRTLANVFELLIGPGYRGWRIDHSPSATRRAAYARSAKPVDFLRPMNLATLQDDWPHLLWLAPGCSL
jgi:FkbM family methyltransferase